MYQCHKCDRTFTLRSTLNRHLRRQNPCNIINKCPICSKVFSKQSKLNRHLQRKTPCQPEEPKLEEETPKFICGLCNSSFNYRFTRDRHYKNYCPVRKLTAEEWLEQIHRLQNQIQTLQQKVKTLQTQLQKINSSNDSDTDYTDISE